MIKKTKKYSTKFSPEIIKSAHKVYCEYLDEETKLVDSNLEVEFGRESLSLDNESDFYSKYQKPIDHAQLIYTYRYNSSLFHFQIFYESFSSEEATVGISLPLREHIEKVFNIFDENYKESEHKTSTDQDTNSELRKTKIYKLKFSPEIVEKAHRVFCDCLEDGFTLSLNNLTIGHKNEILEPNTEDEFYSMYREDISRAEMYYTYRKDHQSPFLSFSVDFSQLFYEEATRVRVTLSSQEDIDKVLAVFDINYEENQKAILLESLIFASKKDRLKEPFVLTARDLRKVDRVLGSSVTYTVKCSDGLKREFTDVEQLIQYENPPEREIWWVVISSKSYSPKRSAVISLGPYDENEVDIRGPENEVIQLSLAVKDCLIGMRPWYAHITKFNFGMKMSALIFATLLFLTNHSLSELSTTDGMIWVILATIVLFIVSHILEGLKARFFPKAVFAIGQGAKRYDDQEKIRLTVIVGFVISFLAGLVFWLVS